jgi:cytochrome c oxidase cbb3-type subunit 3
MSNKNEETQLHVEADEKHLLLGHNYDGIQELNHPLPSWWNFLFWALIAVSGVYYVYYEFMSGPTLREEFNVDYAKIQATQEEFRKQNLAFKNDMYAAVVANGGVKKGEEVFINNCLPCHAENGRGDIGPNLTDKYWLVAKSTPETIYNIVFNGSEANGMPPWNEVLTAEEIYLSVAFVTSLKNTHQKNGKAAQGELIEE